MMFSEEARDAGCARRLRKLVEWSIAFAQGDNLLLGVRRRENFAEAPDAAEVESGVQGAAFAPEGFQSGGVA